MTRDLSPLLHLIQQHSTMSLVRELLKSKGAYFSASSWAALIETRVIPALNEGLITEGDLHSLLRQTEEFGGQHIFLYKCSPKTAREICTSVYLEATLNKAGLAHLLDGPVPMDMPSEQTIIDVRIDEVVGEPHLVIKTAEPRESWRYSREELVGDELHRISEKVFVRSSNVARLSPKGLLEIRIASRSNTSKYSDDLMDFQNIISDLIDLSGFREHSLRGAKHYITKNAAQIKESICVSQAKYRDNEGYSITAAAGSPTATLADSASIDGAVGSFTDAVYETYCEHTNIWFLKTEGQECPSKDIHVLLSGEVHEFAVTSKCSPDDYEYVLSTISEFNEPVSE